MRALLAVTVAGGLAAGCCAHAGATQPTTAAAAPGSPASGASSRVPGEYLVTLASGADPKAIEAAFAAAGVTSIRPVGVGLYLVTVRDDPGPERMESLRANDPRIRAVQPNFVYRSTP
jgi:hypothetical protein